MRAGRWLAWVGGRREGEGAASPEAGAAGGGGAQDLRRIPVAAIRPNPFQPRTQLDDASLEELAESIRRVGLLQPLLVRPGPAGGYELVAGERRWRAALRAGLEEVPAVVRPLSDRDAAVLALVENLQREELGFFEEALAYQDVIQRFGLTQEELASLLGRQQSTIANKLRLLRLPPAVRDRIVAAGLSERHARALLRLPTAALQEAVLEEAVAGGWSVRQLEERIAAILKEERSHEPPAGGSERGGARRRRRLEGLRAIKDVRILLNTVRAGVETLRRAGLDARVEEREDEGFVEVRIRIPKAGRGTAARGRDEPGHRGGGAGAEGGADGSRQVAAPSP